MVLGNLFKKTRRACAYLINQNTLLVHTESRTRKGLWIATAPYFLHEVPYDLKSTGQSIVSALDASEVNIPDPDNWSDVRQRLVKAAGTSSYRRLQQTSIYCGISKENNKISFTPTHNGGTKGDSKGFHFHPDKTIEMRTTKEPVKAGEALMKCFKACTTIYE